MKLLLSTLVIGLPSLWLSVSVAAALIRARRGRRPKAAISAQPPLTFDIIDERGSSLELRLWTHHDTAVGNVEYTMFDGNGTPMVALLSYHSSLN